MSKSKGIFII